ncbi:MAG: HlyC/CorC family transporter [Ottowia sp.]|uniref:hemolysin family protein n=1 Tax=Ottowia sp. TaxID=1898956 RepID=UPI001B7007EA|nr:hemolysin family protein [Ottowia sp.]MBP6665520.1 HlyC/CorC family transporter [Ottowia sp.]MBP7456885.1 HlyC/CorC family transporter [Ottowia sp.]MBP8862472.1 HlyC/CorC family transporter [Ottowia sp.]MBP8928557.1 HlyC/CorC family transporter [Ottowia sp.]MBP9523355.1 HlyC/CorC family transporter [Ottowia sp.]
MSFTQSLLIIVLLIAASAFFSVAEISLAASRRLRLRQLADDGDARALRVLRVQEQPGFYFTAVQIGLNAIAILGGIVGEGLLSPYLAAALKNWLPERTAATLAFAGSVAAVTSLFVVFADLVPKRLGMAEPERVAMAVVGPMERFLLVFKPIVWLYTRCTDVIMRLLGLPTQRDDRITPDDILALAEAGTQAGVLDRPEQQVIENVFELDTRTVTSAMTPRDRIAWLRRDATDEEIRLLIAAEPFSTYPVCDGGLDQVLGYVDAKDLFQRVLKGTPIRLTDEGLLHKLVVVPDSLSLSEVLLQFREQHEDFALIVNEYSTVVGVVTLNDVMSTVMGELVTPEDEDLIVRRGDGSWLIDGHTPMQDVQRALGLDDLPGQGEYDTLAGFLMMMLRRVPRRTDSVTVNEHRFEVMDVDNYRIDQVLVTRAEPPSAE